MTQSDNSLQVCIHLRNQGARNVCPSIGLSSRVANDLVVGYLPNSVLVFGALILWQTGEHSARGILVQPRLPVNNDLCHLVEVLDMPSNLAIQVAVQSNQVVEFSYRSRPAQPLPRSTRTTVANTLGNTGAWAVTLIAHALRSYVHLSTDSGKHHVHLSTGDALYMVHGADLVQQAIAFSFRRARTPLVHSSPSLM